MGRLGMKVNAHVDADTPVEAVDLSERHGEPLLAVYIGERPSNVDLCLLGNPHDLRTLARRIDAALDNPRKGTQ